ncbi:MAG: hypothetical protein FWC23_07215 [Chitinispirillia bacterium]|nr:hypothetical protein [Chitinispirillia bacterium]MCL2268958.1 hypothetical protein [Chitinispirillia bacterium]
MKTIKDSNSGGVALRVVICVVSLLFLAGAIVVLLGTFQSGKEDDHRRAVTLAEYGLQQAFSELAVSDEWSDGFNNEPMDDGGGSFGVIVTRDDRGDEIDIKIVSTGTSGSITKTEVRTVRMRLTVSEEGDSAWEKEILR